MNDILYTGKISAKVWSEYTDEARGERSRQTYSEEYRAMDTQQCNKEIIASASISATIVLVQRENPEL
jgi:hypothetical protein